MENDKAWANRFAYMTLIDLEEEKPEKQIEYLGMLKKTDRTRENYY